MGNKTCTCNPKSVVPSKHFYAKGKVDIFMVISLSDYLTPETRENLGRVRGGRGVTEAVVGAHLMRDRGLPANPTATSQPPCILTM